MNTHELLVVAWTWRPAVLAVVGGALAAHVALFRLRHPSRTLALVAAAAIVLLALTSPIDALAQGTLFSAHMLQHMMLTLAAPPLMLLALPRAPEGTAARPRVPALAPWAMGVGAMWIWHAPLLCNAAATSTAVRALQSATLPAMGAAFWWPIVGPRLDRRLSDPAAIAYLFTACGACTVLGVSIAFSPVQVCSSYAHSTDALGVLPLLRDRWGLTPAVDQQLGGLLMWVPGCTAYAAAILAIVARFYGAAPLKTQGAS